MGITDAKLIEGVSWLGTIDVSQTFGKRRRRGVRRLGQKARWSEVTNWLASPALMVCAFLLSKKLPMTLMDVHVSAQTELFLRPHAYQPQT